ncbi:hypothetical protein DSO57_1014914 [Entomophthora muscae]|uniref:Uncharacterized protein n=1 Tax=Entomophthora muscae TaxID=34485 RepID=A0ACC2T5S8_9FUNG|nr:hypothetical protein DSO57_1014914 [Entomophthora muscae]
MLPNPAVDGAIFLSPSPQETVNLVPQLSPVSSLWSPLRAAVPVLHWAASWWFTSPEWEPNLVSLAPLSHTFAQNRPCTLMHLGSPISSSGTHILKAVPSITPHMQQCNA